MVDLLLILMRILFPLDPVARLREVTRDYLGEIGSWLENPLCLDDLRTDPQLCALLEAHIIVAEYGVHLLIHERARQLAGLPFIYTPRLSLPERRRARPLHEVFARLSRLAKLFDNLDRLAHRRAQRMRLELNANPVRLDASHRSISPSLRLVEANHRSSFNIQIASISAQHWRGQRAALTIGASSRRDGGALRNPMRLPSRQSRTNFARACLIEHQRGRGRLSELI